jgi:nicotinamide mononucleotide transporter
VVEVLQQMDWFEFAGLTSGLLCVWLLIRQNIWTWPIGLLYAVISVAVFYRARLYADLGLHVYYVAINAYGWWYWLRGKRPQGSKDLPVVNIDAGIATGLAGAVIVGTVALGWFLANHTDASLPYWDSATTTMSFAAMWMTARKQLQNWYVWLAVDVLSTGIYLYKDINLYALLYCVYTGMAVAGWWAWRQSMLSTTARVAPGNSIPSP